MTTKEALKATMADLLAQRNRAVDEAWDINPRSAEWKPAMSRIADINSQMALAADLIAPKCKHADDDDCWHFYGV